MNKIRASVASFFVALLLFAVVSGDAQVSTGTIAGSVTDATGGGVVGGKVTATNAATGIATTSTSDAAGRYSLPNLQPGSYSVAVAAPGFSEQVVDGLDLKVGGQQELNFSLRIGAVTEKVVVTATLQGLDLVSSTNMPVVDERTIVELPLNGRDWTSLANLQPGVASVRTQPAVAVTNQRANRGVGNQLTVGGARPQQNNYRVDGVSINDYSNGGPGGVIGSNLGVDAIQEFSVVTSNASADYGKTAGGIINAVSRAGGSKLHGNVYEFIRNSALDARNEFDQPHQIAEFRRNQFGASAGGPIFKSRTFVFGDYEGLRQYQGISVTSNVPNSDARSGLLCINAACASKVQSPVSAAVTPYLTFYPLPNSGVIDSPTSDIGTFAFNTPQISHENYYITRVDHKISDRDSLNGTYFYDRGDLESPDPFNVRITGNLARRTLATIGESHIFNPSLLNSARLGYSRVVSIAPTTLSAVNASASSTSLGFVPALPVGLINIGAVSNFQGGLKATGEFDFHLNSYQVYDDVYLTRGKHSIKFGFAFERLQNNQLGTSNPNGQFIFSSLATFLSDTPTSFNGPLQQGVSPRDLRQSVFGGYVTDNYRMTQRLTLNLGLRYEPVTVPTETAARLAVLPTVSAAAPHLGNPYFKNGSYLNFAPRLGFVYDPLGKGSTSIRGGFGLYDTQTLNYLYEGLSIFTAPYLLLGNITTLAQGDFPTNAYAKMNTAGPVGLRYAYADQTPKRGYVEQYSLNVQQQLAWNTVLQVGYAGSRGIHLPYRVDDINTVQPIRDSIGYGFYGPNCTSCPTAAALTAAKLNPNVGQVSAVFMSGYSHYNSLQASLNKKFSHNVQFGVSYTWAKSIDDGSSSTFGDTFANSVSSLPTWAPNRRRAISDFIVAHNVVANYMIELPKVREEMAGSQLLNGWQWGGIFQFSTGGPFTPLISGDPLNLKSADTFDFPDRIRGTGCTGNPTKSFNALNRQFVNTACFAFPAFDPVTGYTHLGSAVRNSIIAPSLTDFDTSLIKNTPIHAFSETLNIQFRAELFNVANHANYNPPPKAGTQFFGANGAALSAASSGVLVGPTATSSRQAQFALKLIF
jgi:Carboxypeptidase regulatory-like domain/TonB-dependent Receptor Plug Domain/TonB dependent receptor